METDTLSTVLRAVRLRGAVFFDVKATSPWVEETPPAAAVAREKLGRPEHLVSYHAVAEGACWVEVPGEPAVRLGEGDAVVLPRGEAHTVSSAPGMRAGMDVELRLAILHGARLPVPVQLGTDGEERVRLACGFLGCDRVPYNPVLEALPRILVLRERDAGARSLLPLVRLALTETSDQRSGGAAVLGRLSELLFLEAVRRHLESLPEGSRGWLAGLRDPHVGRALAAIHARPAAPWTLAGLAREAGLSRTALAERFVALAGCPPMQYVAQWRLQLAAGLLAEGAKVAAVAEEVGYESEAAFSRAFKRVVGRPPSSYRLTAAPRPR